MCFVDPLHCLDKWDALRGLPWMLAHPVMTLRIFAKMQRQALKDKMLKFHVQAFLKLGQGGDEVVIVAGIVLERAGLDLVKPAYRGIGIGREAKRGGRDVFGHLGFDLGSGFLDGQATDRDAVDLDAPVDRAGVGPGIHP